MAEFYNPNQNLRFPIPEEGELFLGTDPNFLYKREGSQILHTQIPQGFNFSGLQQYNSSDIATAFPGTGKFVNYREFSPTLFNNQITGNGGIEIPVDLNLQKLISSGNINPNKDFFNVPNTITGESLKSSPTLQYSNPTAYSIPDISNLEAPNFTGTLTEPEKNLSDIDKQIMEINNRLLGKSAFTREQETAAGIPQTQQALDDLGGRLRDIQRQAAAIPIQLRAGAEGRGITTQILGRQQEKLLQDNAIEALTVSSLIDATRGMLTSAQRKVDRAVAAKYDPEIEKKDVLIENAKLIKNDPEYSAADRKRAAQVEAIKTAQKIKIQDARVEQKEIWNLATEAVKNGLRDTTIMEKIRLAKTKEEALQIASPYLQKKETVAKILNILDVAKYNELYPEAGVVAGDTEAQANAKVARINTPEAKTRSLIIAAQKAGNSYETVVKEINNDTSIKDKTTALKIAQEVYGVTPKNASETKINTAKPFITSTSKLSGITGQPIEKIGNSIFNFLFGK